MRRTAIATVCAFLCAGVCMGADVPRPQAAAPFMRKAPAIDGKIDEAEWAGAVRNVGFSSQYGTGLTAREAVFWAGADRANLYIAVLSEVAPDGQLLTRAVPDGDRDIVRACYDDSVEVVVHPHLGATAGDRRYFHFIVNERGALYDLSIDEGNRQNPVSTAWRLKSWTFANRVIDGRWHVEIAIPFSEIGASVGDTGRPWGLRICRNWQRPWDQSRWESVSTDYHDVPTMPLATLGGNAPVVQVLGLAAAGKPKIEIAVANPSDAPAPTAVFISDTWSRNPPTEREWTKTIPPGGREVFALEPPHGGAEGAHRTILRVASADGSRTHYLRDFQWRLERPADVWALEKEDKQAIVLQFKVYPSFDKMKVRLDINALASKERVTGAEVSLVKRGTAKPLLTAPLEMKNNAGESVMDTPRLGEGVYEIRAVLKGGQGVPTEPAVGVYERKVFPWEGNRLGLSDRVIPPFTPIRVDGRSLSTVLRTHRLNDAGLWDQVTSLGKPLLKRPMAWTVSAGKKELPVVAGRYRTVSRKASAAVTEGSFSAGPLKAAVRTEWDYDGMAKVVLTIPPAAGGEIDRLSLEVPLDDARMGYLHGSGDSIRCNYAGKTPAGDGVVWDSSKANRINIVGPFYPYVWVGGGERGFCWFADTDRDWSLDEKTPTIELVRRDGVLTMRVSFVTQPTRLDRARTIVFGMMATPAKPMPEEPVNWRRWLGGWVEGPKVQQFGILGASLYYGCTSYDLYPIGKDFSIYAAFSKARDTGVYDGAFVKTWLEKYKAFAEPGTDRWKYYDAHIGAGMRTAAGTLRSRGAFLTPYTNPRGMGFQMEEWPAFQDEWIQFPYFQRAKEGGVAYEVCPVKSFQDAALWYYRDMMTCFDGIYWDNLYLSANYDTVAGGAWVDEKGRTHPSMGLWAMRDLVRRTAVLFNEMGRPVHANIPHMTNANLVPVFSFADINLDWEWQYGKRDFQDRFTADFTVAETIGRQCGTVPLVLAGGFYDSKDPVFPWVMRTRLGVCLVHELRIWDWQPAFHYEMYRKLFEFGYGEKACRVYNYWDDEFPLRVSGCDAKGIVMVNGKRAVAIVTDYSEGGECAIALDLKALGLPAGVAAKDFETGAPMASSGGAARFPLKKHDFKAVLFE